MFPVKSDFINIMQERGFIHQHTNLEGLDQLLATESVTAYCGVDPTANSMHIGHLVPFMMMRWLQKTGHRPIALVGGVTALLADPTGKDETRPILDESDVQRNAEELQKIFSCLLDFEGKNGARPAIAVNNAQWLRNLNYIDFLRDYGKHFSINRMLSMESVRMRLERESFLSFLEFNYMIMQGYDFLELYRTHGCRLQLSGSDQWGNVLQGVELGRRVDQVELFGMTAPLLMHAGKKMGKSEGNAAWLNPERLSPYDFYQFFRNTDDADVGQRLAIYTELPMDEVNRLKALKGTEINEAKKILAHAVTAMIHGQEQADLAAETARKTFEEGIAAEGLPTVHIERARLEQGIPAFVLFKDAGLASSGGEARRLIAGGGARVNDNKIENDSQLITVQDMNDEGCIKLSAGKKKHALVVTA